MYKIVIHKTAAKKLADTPESHLRKLYSVLENLKTNPVPWKEFDVRKIRGVENTYRIRIGDY